MPGISRKFSLQPLKYLAVEGTRFPACSHRARVRPSVSFRPLTTPSPYSSRSTRLWRYLRKSWSDCLIQNKDFAVRVIPKNFYTHTYTATESIHPRVFQFNKGPGNTFYSVDPSFIFNGHPLSVRGELPLVGRYRVAMFGALCNY